MEKLRQHLNRCPFGSVGFYLSTVALALSIVTLFVYAIGFSVAETLAEYYSYTVVLFLVLGIVLYLILYVFDVTAEFAAIAIWAFDFAALLAFADTAYMYLSGIFYNGVTLSAFGMINGSYMATAALLIVAFIVSLASIWFRQTAKPETEGAVEIADEEAAK